MEKNHFQLLKVERFSPAKYHRIKKHSNPFRLISADGRAVQISAENVGPDKKDIYIETATFDAKRGEGYDDWRVDEHGKGYLDSQRIFILVGGEDLKRGDIIICTNYPSSPAEECPMAVFDSISRNTQKGIPGIHLTYMAYPSPTGDMHKEHFYALDNPDIPFFVRKATPEEAKSYYDRLQVNGIRFDESTGSYVPFPCVNQPYWTIEMEDGHHVLVRHEGAATEADRPYHSLCFTNLDQAQYVLTIFKGSEQCWWNRETYC